MLRQRYGITQPRRHREHGHAGWTETARNEAVAGRSGPSNCVPGALADSPPANAGPFGNVYVPAAEIIGESHTRGLSVLWMVLCDPSRHSQAR
jgi:hypothetical protein